MPHPIEIRSNGELQVRITASDDIQTAALTAMAKRTSENPAALTMTFADGVAVFSIGAKS